MPMLSAHLQASSPEGVISEPSYPSGPPRGSPGLDNGHSQPSLLQFPGCLHSGQALGPVHRSQISPDSPLL